MIPDFADYEEIKARHTRGRNGYGGGWRELEFVCFADMRPRLDGRPLVKGILEREQLSVMRGDAGCGKTFLALDLSLHVAAGLDWFGRRVNQGAVIYIAAEAGRGIINRVAAFKRAHGYDDDAAIPFAAITSAVDLCHAEAGDVDRLISLIREANFDPLALLVIDTVSRALAGGNENSPDDMGALVRSLDTLRDELRCHAAAVHHVGKDVSKGGRGHSLLHCAVDTELEVVHNEVTGIRTATIVKQRDGPTEGQIAFQLRQVELGYNVDGDLITSCIVEAADNGAGAPKKRRHLSAQQSIALQQLTNAINTAGCLPPASVHIPTNTYCVDEAIWRDYCYRGGVSSGAEKGQQKAFSRAKTALLDANRIGCWDPFVWIISQ